MNTQAIELETLKQLELMNKENKTKPSLMLPKYLDGNLVITNGFLALKISDGKYNEDGRTDYPSNVDKLFDGDEIGSIELSQIDMKSLKEIASTFKRLKEDTITITFCEDDFIINGCSNGYSNNIEIKLPYQKIVFSGDIINKEIIINPKYVEQMLAYYIKLKSNIIDIKIYGDNRPIQITSGNVQYLACQIRKPR